MNFLLKKIELLFLALLMVVSFSATEVSAAPEILTANQLSPGMRGMAKTVIEGTRIDTFSIEIIGVMDESKDGEGKIIARASGDVIDRTDGVLQGMSGSPVYIDGKLIGAVSGGWKEIDKRTCIITPIADMLKLWNLPDDKNKNRIAQIDLKKIERNQPEKGPDMPKLDAEPEAQEESLLSETLSTPLMVSGFGQAGLGMLKEKLQPFQMMPYATGGTGKSNEVVAIEPGSSVGVQIVRGDISMAAIGTVTAVENGKVLAFGHPFLRKGNVNYFMTDANIITTASGTAAGFKVGVPGNAIGRINQDRSAAVAGVLGQYPSVVPLKVTVEDAQLRRKNNYAVQIAYDEDLIAVLVPSIVYNAMDSTIDRVGAGTAQLSFEIMTNSAQSGLFKRDNMFYNPQDVGQVAVGELFQTLSLMGSNAQQEADIVGIKVNVKVDEARRTASIIEVSTDKPSVKAGDIVNLKIKLKPYRKAEETVIIPYKVPQHQAKGMMNLEVRGGGLVPLALLLLQQQGLDLSAQDDKMIPLEVKLKGLAESNKNNEIIVAPALAEEANGAKPPKKHMPQAVNAKNPPLERGEGETPQFKHKTNYIIDNMMPFSVKVTER